MTRANFTAFFKKHFATRQDIAGALTCFVPIALVLGRAPADIVVSIIALIFLADSALRRNWAWIKRAWVLTALILWAYSTLRACFIPHGTREVFAAFVWLRYIFFAAGTAYWILPQEKFRTGLFRTTIASMLFLSVDAILQYVAGFDIIGHPKLDAGRRLTATFTHPIVGITIASLFAPPLFWFLERKKFLFSSLFGGVCFLAILLSGERMALLLGCGIMAVWLYFLLRGNKKMWASLIAGFCIVVIVLSLRPDLFERQVASTLRTIEHADTSPYGLAWMSALHVGEAYPLFGVGIHQFRVACLEDRFGPLVNAESQQPRCLAHPHNIYIEWFSEGGSIGFAGFLSFLAALFVALGKRLFSPGEKLVLWGLATTLAIRFSPFFTSTSFYNNWSAIPCWLFIGWAMNCEVVGRKKKISLAFKRLLDIFASAVLLVLCSPLLAATGLAVHTKIGSPVLFRQQRVGKDEKLFTIYKFRSMRDARDASDKPLSDEARLTGFGEKLRASSLDELPELWNILKGDMSLIGPRPLLPEYLPYYSDAQKQRHRMRPGLTGLAQIKGRNAVGWEERLAFDAQYVREWSLWLDLQILLATVGIVLSRRGINAEGAATMPRFDDFVRTHQQSGMAGR